MITPWQFNTHVPQHAGPQPWGRASASMWKRFSTQLNVQYLQYEGPGARPNSVVLSIEASCGLTQFAPPLYSHTSPCRSYSSDLALGFTFMVFMLKLKWNFKKRTFQGHAIHRKTGFSQEARSCYWRYCIYKEQIQFKRWSVIGARESNLASLHPTAVLKCLNNFLRHFVTSRMSWDTVAFIPFSLISFHQAITHWWGPKNNKLIMSKVGTSVFYIQRFLKHLS